jgi:hypothetical protein
MSGSSSLPEAGTIVLCHLSIEIGTVADGPRTRISELCRARLFFVKTRKASW